MNMKEFERFNNVMDASIDKVVTDHLNKLSDIEYCVTNIQNIITNGGNTETLLPYATECVNTIKDEIEYFNSIDNITTSNLKELEEVKGRNRQLKEINRKILDTFKSIEEEKNKKICELTTENDKLNEIKVNLENEIKLKCGECESFKSEIEEKNREMDELNNKIISLETSLRNSEQSRDNILNKINDSLNDIVNTNKSNSNISDESIGEIKNNLTFIKKVLNGEKDKKGNKVPGVIGRLDIVDSKLDNSIVRVSGIKDYTNDISRIENKVDSLSDSINKLDNTEKDKEIADRINKLDKTIDMIDENARALTYVYKTKKYPNKDLKGEKNPRYNTLINNDELIKDYKDGMILKELSTKYGLTIPGIRNRLIYLGVYEKKYNTGK